MTVVERATALLSTRSVRGAALALALGAAAWNLQRTPHTLILPALLGLAPWIIGKYVLCPLRWHALSLSGRSKWWHIRAYAESELLGLATPAHAGADLWRVHRLEKVEMRRSNAVAEVGLDRLVGAIGLTLFVLLSGASLPLTLLVAAIAIAVTLIVAGLLVARLRPNLLPRRPLPSWHVLARGLAYSIGYQLTVVGLLIGAVEAVGGELSPMKLLGVFGASQVAGIIPGVNGASPREGALVVGLAALGLSWTSAFGAVALVALLAWGPGLLLGGGSLLVHHVRARAARRTPALA